LFWCDVDQGICTLDFQEEETMDTRNTMENGTVRSNTTKRPRLVSFGILAGSAILLHGIVFTSLDIFVPIEGGASSEIALVIDDGMEPMDMLVYAR
tara:strand:+ start:283 stop:570 length:288 start_codon:yes stop_codon:yes gene_type:complete